MDKLKTWARGNEIEVDGTIEKHFGGFFFVATVTNHPENPAHLVGSKDLIACYQLPHVSQAFGLKVYTTATE